MEINFSDFSPIHETKVHRKTYITTHEIPPEFITSRIVQSVKFIPIKLTTRRKMIVWHIKDKFIALTFKLMRSNHFLHLFLVLMFRNYHV